MKSIESFSIDERIVELLKRYASAISSSKSQIVETALADYFERGGPSNNLESQYKKKALRLEILQKQELENAIKGSRSISLTEVGDRNE